MSSSESIETTAATIDQAIGQALAQLGAEHDDVTIEVLSTPRSGVLGLGARPARVRVTRRAPQGARSGVMSPPPAPPLRPTPPEMRRPEARPEPRVAPPREDGVEPSRVEPGREPRELAADEPGEDARRTAPEPPRDAVREAPGQAPQRGPERGDLRRQALGDEPRRQRNDLPRQAETEGTRRGRSDLPRQETGNAQSRQAPHGPARASSGAQARQAHSELESGHRGGPLDTDRSEVQGGERGEALEKDRSEISRDDREARGERNDQRDNGRAGGRPRRGRGRGRGRSSGSSAGSAGGSAGSAAEAGERGGRSRSEAQPARSAEPRDQDQDRDEDRDPFASVDEPGNDPRKIADLQEQAREATIFLERILELMGEQAKIEPAESDDPETLELNIKGDGSGILIGRHGQTLDAIEYMVNRLLARKIKDSAPISIDTESYRARRRRLLQRMALSKGEQAKREHVSVILDPMPPRDRRIVHLALKDDPMIATRSTGEGFLRAIEIVPVDERHDPNDRGNENRGRGRGRGREVDRDKAAPGEQGGFKHGQKRIV